MGLFVQKDPVKTKFNYNGPVDSLVQDETRGPLLKKFAKSHYLGRNLNYLGCSLPFILLALFEAVIGSQKTPINPITQECFGIAMAAAVGVSITSALGTFCYRDIYVDYLRRQ